MVESSKRVMGIKPLRVAITGGKGGTGKSTIACSLALSLAEKFKVLLVDADVECPDDHIILSVKQEKIREVTIPVPSFDHTRCLMCGKCSEACREHAIVHVHGHYPIFIEDRCNGCGACILTCPNNAIGTSEKVIGSVYEGFLNEKYPKKLRENFTLISGEAEVNLASTAAIVDATIKNSHDVDIIIIDTAVGVHCNVIHALIKSHIAFAITEPTPLGAHDLKLILKLLKKLGIDSNIVLNRAGIGDDNIIYNVSRESGIPVAAEIPYSETILRAYSKGKPFKIQGITDIVKVVESLMVLT